MPDKTDWEDIVEACVGGRKRAQRVGNQKDRSVWLLKTDVKRNNETLVSQSRVRYLTVCPWSVGGEPFQVMRQQVGYVVYFVLKLLLRLCSLSLSRERSLRLRQCS
jgi:hypothetical protein